MVVNLLVYMDKVITLDPKIWGRLPSDLVEKICNMLIYVRRIDTWLRDSIVYEWHKFDSYYWRLAAMFDANTALYVMYDDMKNVAGIYDSYPEDMPFELVVREMWKEVSREDRNELLITN